MDWSNYYQELIQFLNTYSSIWQTEVLEQYPLKQNNPLLFDLTKEIQDLSDSDLLKLENDKITSELNEAQCPKLSELVKKIKSLEERIPKREYHISNVDQAKPHLFRKMARKKIHEVLCLSDYINELNKQHRIVDFGGGVGHFCQHLARTKGYQTLCLDKEESFLESGRKRIQKSYPQLKDLVQFKQVTIGEKMHQQDLLRNIHEDKNIYIGLHACGDLSAHLIEFYTHTQNSHLISFGCCYHKTEKKIFNLSKLAQESSMNWSGHALTLAARSNSVLDQNALNKKRKVKLYRYGFHLYLYEEHQIKDFIALGFEGEKPYEKDLVSYFNDNLEKLNLDIPELMKDFDLKAEFKEKIEFLIRAGFIRSLFGRLIEIAILVDRLLYLQESNKEVNLYEFFDKQLSPRNLGIVV